MAEAMMVVMDQRSIRPAARQDSFFIWNLAMDPSVREMSTRSKTFTYPEHLKWYESKLNSRLNRIWIMEVDGIPVGQIRYGRVNTFDGTVGLVLKDEAEIAVSVSPVHRQHGYAKELLLTTEPWAREWLGVTKLVALVLKVNQPSRLLFISCGYSAAGSEERMGKDHWRFEKP